MSLPSRRELTAVVSVRYQCATRNEKARILDDFVVSTGYNRKYAIRLLARPRAIQSRCATPEATAVVRKRRRTYGDDVQQALLSVWEIAGGICPKRLVPSLPLLIEALERFDEIHLLPPVREKLLTISPATTQRLISAARRAQERGISTTLPGTLLRQQIPIRTYEEWTEGRPGFMEIDLVAHCGGSAAGDYIYTLTMTDVWSGWTQCYALINRSQTAVQAGIDHIRRRLPFPLLGIDSDNGGEFINHNLKRYCDDHQIIFTRCRPYKKNDQCHVEQKNGRVVRPLTGYARYEGAEAAAYLNTLYEPYCRMVNFFQASMKLISKTRTGAHVKKTHDQAQTPWARLRGYDGFEDKDRWERYFHTLNPAQLHRRIFEKEMGLRHLALPVAWSPPDTSGDAGATLGKRNVTLAPKLVAPTMAEQGGCDHASAP